MNIHHHKNACILHNPQAQSRIGELDDGRLPENARRQAFAIARRVEKTVQAHGIAHVTVQTEPPEHNHPQATCATPAHIAASPKNGIGFFS